MGGWVGGRGEMRASTPHTPPCPPSLPPLPPCARAGQSFLSMLCSMQWCELRGCVWVGGVVGALARDPGQLAAPAAAARARDHPPPPHPPLSLRGVFIFFSVWVAAMTVFVLVLLPGAARGQPQTRESANCAAGA